jgi:hypothetical protein
MVNPELDKFMMMFNALLVEVSALRDRIDTHEALGKAGLPIAPEEVDAFRLTEAMRAAREARREAMLKRVYRIVLDELEQARTAISTRELEEVLASDGRQLPEDSRL